MRRKYNDLLAKRAGILTEAESLLKEGKREDYKSRMSEIGSLNEEIAEVKALIDEQDRRFLEKQDTPAEQRDKALERAEILRKGGEVKFSAAEVRKAITLATATLAEPTGTGTNIRGGDSAISSIIDQVSVVNLAGMGEYQEPYVLTELDAKAGTVASTAGKARTASTDPTFGVAVIKPYDMSVTSFVDRNIGSLTPADYYAKIYGMAMRAMRRKVSELIVNGDGETSHVFYGMKNAKNKAGNDIFASVDVSAVDVDLLDTLYFAYGADTELGGSARLLLTKTDLKAIGALRGTNEKRRLFTIEPDMANPNTGVIRDGGVVIPYTLCPDLTSLSGSTASATADIQTMIYTNPLNFELGLFSDFTVRVDESYKAQERLLTILGDVMVGGNLVVDKGAVIATLAKTGS